MLVCLLSCILLLQTLLGSVGSARALSLVTGTGPSQTSASRIHDKDSTTDVLIVGAGPAGLVLAHALRDRGFKIRVLERRSSFRPVGSAVFLHPFAINSVRAISPQVADNLVEAATKIGTVAVRSITNEKNNIVFDQFDRAVDVLGAPFVVIKFWDMLQALKKGLPEDIFSFGCDVQSYEELDDGRLQIQYMTRNGNEERVESQVAKTLIDAGGIRSQIRKQLIPDTKSVPACKAYMAVAPAEKALEIMKTGTMVQRELAFYSGDLDAMTVSTMKNGDVWWTYTYFDDTMDSSLPKEELVKRLQKRFPPFLSELITATDDYLEIILADLPISWKWGSGNVTLLGDSAHAQLPSLGLGCSAAFADTEELCRQIDKLGLTPKAFRWYERLRMPQTAFLQWASRLGFSGIRFLGRQKEKDS